MNEPNHKHDDAVHSHLRELGRDAERCAPVFQRVWRAACEAQSAHQPQSRLWFAGWPAAATALAIIALVGLGAGLFLQQPDTPVVMTPAANTEEHAELESDFPFDPSTPTDFLLTVNSDAHTPSVEQLSREMRALLEP